MFEEDPASNGWIVQEKVDTVVKYYSRTVVLEDANTRGKKELEIWENVDGGHAP